MITELRQLTMAQFISLVCGDYNVLIQSGEDKAMSESVIALTARNMIFEYQEIADKSSIKNWLSQAEELAKGQLSVTLYTICSDLVTLSEYSRVREILSVCGIDAAKMNDQRISAEIASRLERAKSTVTRIESENLKNKVENTDIRREFDAQTAGLMAFFKFQIDTATIRATEYANLVALHNKQVKSQLAAMKK